VVPGKEQGLTPVLAAPHCYAQEYLVLEPPIGTWWLDDAGIPAAAAESWPIVVEVGDFGESALGALGLNLVSNSYFAGLQLINTGSVLIGYASASSMGIR
jgi:hypothetical protein